MKIYVDHIAYDVTRTSAGFEMRPEDAAHLFRRAQAEGRPPWDALNTSVGRAYCVSPNSEHGESLAFEVL